MQCTFWFIRKLNLILTSFSMNESNHQHLQYNYIKPNKTQITTSRRHTDMKANNYEVAEAGETITFKGLVARSTSQAFFLVFCTAIGMASLALVLQIQFQDLGEYYNMMMLCCVDLFALVFLVCFLIGLYSSTHIQNPFFTNKSPTIT